MADDSVIVTAFIFLVLVGLFCLIDTGLGHDVERDGTIILKNYDDDFFVVVLYDEQDAKIDVTYAEYQKLEVGQDVTLILRKGGITKSTYKKELKWTY